MQVGVVTGGSTSNGVLKAQQMGIGLVRVYDLDPFATTASINAMVLDAAQKGVRVILLYHTEDVNQPVGNIGAHVASVGLGGTFWDAHPELNESLLAVREIEWLNEMSYAYRGYPGGSWWDSPEYDAAARAFARSILAACDVVAAANPNVRVIGELEDGGSQNSAWIDAVFDEEPTLKTKMGGGTIHPYGETGGDAQARLDGMVSRLNGHGATTMPLYITEDGIASDNGNGLNKDSYGWGFNVSYAQQAQGILDKGRWVGSRPYASRIRCWLYYKAVDDAAPGATNDQEAYFGVYRPDGVAKGNSPASMHTLSLEFPASGVTPPTSTPPIAPTALSATVAGPPGQARLTYSLPADANRTNVILSRRTSAWPAGGGSAAGTVVALLGSTTGVVTGAQFIDQTPAPATYFYKVFALGPGGETGGPTASVLITTEPEQPPPPPGVPPAVASANLTHPGSAAAVVDPAQWSTRRTGTSVVPAQDGGGLVDITAVAAGGAAAWSVVEALVPIRFNLATRRAITFEMGSSANGASVFYLAAVRNADPSPHDPAGAWLRIAQVGTQLLIESDAQVFLDSPGALTLDDLHAYAVEIGSNSLRAKVDGEDVVGSSATAVPHGLPFAFQAFVVLESFAAAGAGTHVATFGPVRVFATIPAAGREVSVVAEASRTLYTGLPAAADEGVFSYRWEGETLPAHVPLDASDLPDTDPSPNQIGPALADGEYQFWLRASNHSPFGS